MKARTLKLTRYRYLALGLVVLLGLSWGAVQAEMPAASADQAQRQLKQILPSLNDSEAEHASGAYIPGVGAIITMDLLRGPNSVKGKQSQAGTRDWLLYIVQTFGAKLSAVPENETIAFSVDFYDYAQVYYHQLVISCRAGDIKDPGKYKVWLDSQPYGQAADPNPAPAQTTPPATQATSSPAPAPTAQANNAAAATPTPGQAPATTGNGTTPPASSNGTNSSVAAGLVGSGGVNLSFDANVARGDWKVLNGTWDFTGQGYAQTMLGQFDLVSFYAYGLQKDYRVQVNLRYLEGDMGGGLVFNAPSPASKNNGYMVSYTGKGSYLQWGYYDNKGIFQYQGGLGVTNSADGKTHTLGVQVSGNTYNVSLDGTVVGQKIPLSAVAAPAYVGLLASTSHVLFNNFILDNIQQ